MKHLNFILKGILDNPVLEKEFKAAFPKKYHPGGKSLCPWHKGRKPTLEFIDGKHARCSECHGEGRTTRPFDRTDLYELITGRDWYNCIMDLGERDDLVLQRGGVYTPDINPQTGQPDEFVFIRRATARMPLGVNGDQAAQKKRAHPPRR